MIGQFINQVGEWNPQLFRELKGQLKSRNLAIASAISIVGQFLLFLYYESLLPMTGMTHNRYCTGYKEYQYSQPLCIRDLFGHWVIFEQLWWLDLFIALSVIGIIVLLVVGTYMLIADLSKEEQRGTLNFIRISPQTAKSIFIGKVLGVPILLYWVAILALPLHLMAGLSARVPLPLILVFDGVLIASCALFYNAALLFALFGLASGGLGGFQAWLGSGLLFPFLFILSVAVFSGSFWTKSPFDWVILFYPGTVLTYLVQSTHLAPATVGYLKVDEFKQFLWYGQPLWDQTWMGVSFILFNYGWWTYWITQALKRRFHNPVATILSKTQSYWITGSFMVIVSGFILQSQRSYLTQVGFSVFYVFIVGLFLVFIPMLSPHRQALQDWARYRHKQTQNPLSLIQDLIIGEKSPSSLAIALNLGIVATYLMPILFFSYLQYNHLPGFIGRNYPWAMFHNQLWAIFFGFIFGMNMILIYALIAQRMLMMKSPKRLIASGAMIATLIILPLVCFGFFRIDPHDTPWPWFFSVLPIVATQYAKASVILGCLFLQWLIIGLLGWQMSRQLQKAGASETRSHSGGI